MPNDPKPPVPRCPICDRPARPENHPFCSDRCRQVDLGRWLNGGYVIPGRELPPTEEAED